MLLHSVLALLPWQEESRPPAVPISANPSPVVSANPSPVVSASQLPSLPAADPQPLSAMPSLPAAASSPPAPPADLIPVASAVEANSGLTEEPAIEEMPAPDSIPVNVSVNEGGEGDRGNEANNSDEGDVTNEGDEAAIAAAWENFIGYLQEQNSEFGMPLLEIFSLFGEPEQANHFFDENNQPRLKVSSYHLFPEQTPEGIVDAIIEPELSNQPDVELQPLGNVSSGLTYQILQGEAFRYLTIVQLNEGSGSVLIMSDSLPAL